MNVRLAWRRDRDGKTVNVCCLCAESGKVNADSIDNYTSEDTLYKGIDNTVHYQNRKTTQGSFFNGKSATRKASRNGYVKRVMEK